MISNIEHLAELCKDSPPVSIMEVCGTHTVSIMRHGIRSILPDNLRLISGPGCPVCVTTQGYIDAAIKLAEKTNVIICTYGDMMRVPGREKSLNQQKAEGSDIRVVYSAHDALQIARENQDKDIVFLAIGFETTSPATAAAVLQADGIGLENFSIISGHKLALPAIKLIAQSDADIDAFLCPGHVSVIIGADAYKSIASDFNKPCVIAGFEPGQIINAIAKAIEMVGTKQADVHNEYPAVVSGEGNLNARVLMQKVFELCDTNWRSIGIIPDSGLALNAKYQKFDAVSKFDLSDIEKDYHIEGCKCGEVIQGKITPAQCPLFGKSCKPEEPVGPCMVSSEGTCGAWYKYNK